MSSSAAALSLRGVGKAYQISHQEPHSTIREALLHRLRRPLRRGPSETVWALREISLEIAPGEVVGVIGRNGAGKSTLLKILSRITAPTTGEVLLRGRVGSLLEVGTGFHPELTGRENIYLNGAILGMTRREVRRQFEAIVEFAGAGVEQFLDTPVKRYSSGMYVRLAFAVAAHLQTEVLLVDEVLAVGDAEFQRRCLGKMEDVAREGRTVLFISHNMEAILRLCRRVVVLDAGVAAFDGRTHDAVEFYLNSGLAAAAYRSWSDPDTAPGTEQVRLGHVRIKDQCERTTENVDIRQPVGIELEYVVLAPGVAITPVVHVHNTDGVMAFSAIDTDPSWRMRERGCGRFRTTAWIPGNTLSEGLYTVDAYLGDGSASLPLASERHAVAFHCVDSFDGDAARGHYRGQMPGVMRPKLRWETDLIEGEGIEGEDQVSPNGAHTNGHLVVR